MSSEGRGPPREETTTLRAAIHEIRGESLAPSTMALHVILDGRAITYPLPPGKTLIVGRSEAADIRIDEPAISRRHLSIEVSGDPSAPIITARDLGSANGVRFGDRLLSRDEPTTLEPGAVLDVGGALLVTQLTNAPVATFGAPVPTRRVWSRSYLEGRIEDECARVERVGGSFTVLRVRTRKEDEARARDTLASELPAADILAVLGPGELAALVLGDANVVATTWAELLARARVTAAVSTASHPRDGRSAQQILATAEARLGGRGAASPRSGARVYGRHLAELEQTLLRIARGDINVLITGETGVGKEVVAEMIHRLSPRVGKPLLSLNCGAFTETLLASELFGHERGAFTGADRAKVGLLESADGGMVFLDEIGEMPLGLQPKLLRVIEAGEVQRVGALRPKMIDVRFVSATNRDLEAEAQAGRFRSDLYFRLAGFTAAIRPLRERPDEIADLARGLLTDAAGGAAPEIDQRAMRMLETYAWPGNVRELRNVLQRAAPRRWWTDHGRAPADGQARAATDDAAARDRRELTAGGAPGARKAAARRRARASGRQSNARREGARNLARHAPVADGCVRAHPAAQTLDRFRIDAIDPA